MQIESFPWSPQPAAFEFVRGVAADFLASVPAAAALADRMRRETGTRFIDWIDHVCLNRGDARAARLSGAGYASAGGSPQVSAFANDGGIFPTVLVREGPAEVALRVESIADFLAANRLRRDVQGNPADRLKTCRIYETSAGALTVVERHGTREFQPGISASADPKLWRLHLENFRVRPRDFANEEDGFAAAHRLIDAATADLGRDLACDLWFAAEREFYMSRNRASRAQKARQDRLGLGWANHDHHTYRCSRKNFRLLVATWEKLGLRCRERFYAGREAGWGAQVMEQPVTGIVTFNDVDLTPDELAGDFGHDGLPEQDRLGTVGLWCGLHGDSFLQSGLHHLAALFDFDALTRQLVEEAAVRTMKPFTDFPYLRQAFTEGERWNPAAERLDLLVRTGAVTESQAAQFGEKGALGSHLENIERNDGFKGFNQAGVNQIIHATDPRMNIGA